MTEMALDACGNVVFKLVGDLFKIAKDKLPKLGLFSTNYLDEFRIFKIL
jgi:hypothetical protein